MDIDKVVDTGPKNINSNSQYKNFQENNRSHKMIHD